MRTVGLHLGALGHDLELCGRVDVEDEGVADVEPRVLRRLQRDRNFVDGVVRGHPSPVDDRVVAGGVEAPCRDGVVPVLRGVGATD